MHDGLSCPICGLRCATIKQGFSQGSAEAGYGGTCTICGNLWIMEGAVHAVPSEKRHLLSAFFRRLGTGIRPTERVTAQNVERLIRDLPSYSPVEKRDVLLNYLADNAPVPGQASSFSTKFDYPLVFAAGEHEAQFYVVSLCSEGLIELDPAKRNHVVTLKGWERVSHLRSKGKTSDRAFVAMSFNPNLNGTYDNSIRPAILDAGYQPIRLDRTEHVNRIDDEIIVQLRDCRFVVADFTQHRHGVYFEAGYGLGLGKTVIWICSSADVQGLHFDTRQFNMIDYSSDEELRSRLLNRILAIEGRGPRRDS